MFQLSRIGINVLVAALSELPNLDSVEITPDSEETPSVRCDRDLPFNQLGSTTNLFTDVIDAIQTSGVRLKSLSTFPVSHKNDGFYGVMWPWDPEGVTLHGGPNRHLAVSTFRSLQNLYLIVLPWNDEEDSKELTTFLENMPSLKILQVWVDGTFTHSEHPNLLNDYLLVKASSSLSELVLDGLSIDVDEKEQLLHFHRDTLTTLSLTNCILRRKNKTHGKDKIHKLHMPSNKTGKSKVICWVDLFETLKSFPALRNLRLFKIVEDEHRIEFPSTGVLETTERDEGHIDAEGYVFLKLNPFAVEVES
jgi:hypothetical protein